MNPRNFFAELKRRNVYKVAVVYGVVAWLLVQAASIFFPTFEAPAWVMKVFVAAITAGFPIALVLAWAFEMTPQGMKRTQNLSPNEPIPQWNRRRASAKIKTSLPLEIAHILFIDVVGYSKMLNNEQNEILQKLNDIVLRTKQVRAANRANQLICLPTGDGMALIFRDLPEAPAKCALEIAAALKGSPEIQLRMGVHSGPVNQIADVNQRPNITGAGVNMAQRVMDCGDAGHILLSRRIAEDLAQYREWQLLIHDLGEVGVKHGLKISLFNLYTEDLGNPAIPGRVQRAKRNQILSTRRRGVALTALILCGILGGRIWWQFRSGYSRKPIAPRTEISAGPATATPLPPAWVTEPAIDPKSIAVLRLQSLSDDKNDAFFAVGLQDDVITRLAKIKDLKVISRSSVVSYGDYVPRNLPEIREELSVAYILLGSVRRDGNRVLVNAHLIDTANGHEIWAESYDRTLADSINLQGEVASEIAGRLRVILSPEEKALVETKPTANPNAWVSYLQGRELQLLPETLRENLSTENFEAYLLYLKGRKLQLLPERSKKNYSTAADFYRKALALDPWFVLARARLSFMQAQLYQVFESENAALLAEARRNADKALSQDANSAEAHLARGSCAQLAGDHALTRIDLSEAVRLRPDDGSIRLAAAVIQQQLGWEKEAAENYKRAAELGPREAGIFLNYGYLLYETGQEVESRAALDHALALEPESVLFRIVRAVAEISWSGDTGRAREILAGLPAGQDPDGRVTSAYCTLAILKRDFPGALKLLQAYPNETLPTIDTGGLGQQDSKVEAEGTIRLYLGNRDSDLVRARECFELVRRRYEDAVKENPKSAVGRTALALLYAWMGWKEAAIAEADLAMELETPAGGPVKRGVILGLAKVYAWAGEPDRAWKQIERFLAFPPSGYSLHNFRLDPVWDPIRNDPRFQSALRRSADPGAN